MERKRQKGSTGGETWHQESDQGKGFYWKQDTGAETIEYYPSGVIRRSEDAALEMTYVNRSGVWKILRSTYRPQVASDSDSDAK